MASDNSVIRGLTSIFSCLSWHNGQAWMRVACLIPVPYSQVRSQRWVPWLLLLLLISLCPKRPAISGSIFPNRCVNSSVFRAHERWKDIFVRMHKTVYRAPNLFSNSTSAADSQSCCWCDKVFWQALLFISQTMTHSFDRDYCEDDSYMCRECWSTRLGLLRAIYNVSYLVQSDCFIGFWKKKILN